MWCESCRQDVPAVANATHGAVCCARCNHPIASSVGAAHHVGIVDSGIDLTPAGKADATSASAAPKSAGDSAPQQSVPAIDDWELDQHLRHANTVLRSAKGSRGKENSEKRYRFDPPRVDAINFTDPAAEASYSTAAQPNSIAKHGSGLGWFTLCIGLMAFACGAVLLGWSFWAARSDLWNLGLPITLGGQCAMILGLIFQMERVAQSGCDTSAALQSVDDRLAGMSQSVPVSGAGYELSGDSSYTARLDAAHFRREQDELQARLDRLAARTRR